MDRRLAIDDRAAAQILGFIVGLAVVTGSLAIATYFITTVPDTGPDEQTQRLQGDARRAIDVLATTSGQPEDWDEDFDPDKLRRVGLLSTENPRFADRHKIQRIQEGNVTGNDILESWNLDPSERAIRIEGRVQSVPIGETPIADTYGVVHANPGSGLFEDSPFSWTIDPTSQAAAETYAEVSPSYTYEEHDWTFGEDVHPDNGLGNTVIDHAYFIETQLFPMMVGIDATYSTADHASTDWMANRTGAFEHYTSTSGQPESATRWHVVAEERPYSIPGNAGDKIDDHVLTVNWRATNGNPENAEGVGLWRVENGARSAALLGDFEIGDADSATLSFDHLLRANDDERNLCPDDNACLSVRPSILFWNTTADQWTRISEDPDGCPASGWNDTITTAQTDGWSNSASVGLCEALEHTDDTVWLSLFWDTRCLNADGFREECSTEKGAHGWFVDNIELSADGSTVWETDMEPPTDRSSQQLFVSNGVDHHRTHAPPKQQHEENTVGYLQNMVRAGGNIVALAPDHPEGSGTPGEWLSQMGLATKQTTHEDTVDTEDPSNIVLRYPHDLPEQHDDYAQENVSWQRGAPSTPAAWSTPSDLENLTVVQGRSDNATILHGQPFEGGGRVAALAYNHTHFDNETLREQLYENLHGSSVFIDPTFDVGDELPAPGSSEVASDRRVMLVGVTPDNRYVVPLEITLWMWDRG